MKPSNSQRSPSHLPEPWKDQELYDRLYDEIDPYGSYHERNGRTIVRRIPPRLSANEVYQRLPSALGYEYAGYLTRTRIVYWKGDARSSRFPTNKECTFHSHPTRLQRGEPDLPSLADMRQFILGRNRRTVTVGRSKLWVWDKSPLTLKVAKNLADWERDNLSKLYSRLTAQGIADVHAATVRHCLCEVGLKLPSSIQGWGDWPKMVKQAFGFRVTVIDRVDY